MRLNLVLNLYKLKVKVFFGAFRASKASIALLFIYILGFFPSMVSLSSAITDALRQSGSNVGVYVDFLAAAISAAMAAAILLSLRGVTAFEYEQNTVFTSPVRPDEFLAANFLTNLTYLFIFAFPLFVVYVFMVFSLGLSLFQAVVIFLISLLLAISLIFLKMSLSLVKALSSGAWINALMFIVVFALMLPTVSLFTPLPLRYHVLPYPSSLFARILMDIILSGRPHLSNLLGFLLFFIVLFFLFALTSKRNFFPFTTQIPLVSPFDVSARTQAFKVESNIRFFSRMSIPLHLDLESRSTLGFLIKKEIIRLVREGSLFSVILIYIVISAVFVAIGLQSTFGSGTGPPPAFLLTLLSSYSIIIPVMLVGNWRILEAKNLWLPISSGGDLRLIMKATLYGFIMVALTPPLAIILPVSILFRISPAPALTILIPTSFIGCSANLYIAVKFLRGGRRGTPSILIGWLSILLTALLVSPAYALITFPLMIGESAAINAIITLSVLAYSLITMKAFLKLIERNARFIEV